MADLSKRYAEALYTSVKDKEKYKKYLEDLTLNYHNTKLKVSLKNPRIDKKSKQEILKAINPEDEKFNNFTKLLLEKNRFDLIEEITRNYNHLLDIANKKLKIKIITPYEITQKQAEEIADKFKKQEKAKEASYELIVDETLIGGIKVNINGKVYDSSVATKLQNIL